MPKSLYTPPRGAALLVALAFSALLAGFVAAMLEMVAVENKGTDSMVLDAQARYLAESGAEYAIQALKRQIANNYPMPAGLNTVVLSSSVPNYEPAAAGAVPKPSIEYKAIRLEASDVRSSVDTDGVTHRYQLYAVTARGFVPDPLNPNRYGEVYVNKTVDIDMVPLFQYLAFYNRFDMEMLPGANMTLKGRIHSNHDVYLGCEPNTTLTLNSGSVKAAGGFYRRRKNDLDNYMAGTVRIRVKDKADTAAVNDTNFPIMATRGGVKTKSGITVPDAVAPSGYDSAFGGYDGNSDGDVEDNSDLKGFAEGAADKWGGTVAAGSNQVPTLEAPTDLRAFREAQTGETATHKYDKTTKVWEEVPPSQASTADSVKGYYNEKADLVLANEGGVTKLLNPSGTVLYDSSNAAANKLKDSSGNNAVDPFSQKQMYDAREGRVVDLFEIDMGKLNSAYYDNKKLIAVQDSSNTPGPVIYAYRTDSYPQNPADPTSSPTPNGFRLTNGAKLDNDLTFVTEDPLYIKGDFNTVANGKKGVVLMADSVNFLSNAWTDSTSPYNAGNCPIPSALLEINAAIMAGAYATVENGGSGGYNGGFENFPRLHENWSNGKTIQIAGSFVSLFTSKFAKGKWSDAAYKPPKRVWDFDTALLEKKNWPPGLPYSVGESRVVWWRGRRLDWWPQ